MKYQIIICLIICLSSINLANGNENESFHVEMSYWPNYDKFGNERLDVYYNFECDNLQINSTYGIFVFENEILHFNADKIFFYGSWSELVFSNFTRNFFFVEINITQYRPCMSFSEIDYRFIANITIGMDWRFPDNNTMDLMDIRSESSSLSSLFMILGLICYKIYRKRGISP